VESNHVERRDVEFTADDGLVLRGWLFVPQDGDRPRAAITMAHGYAGVKEQGIEPFAKAFADAGFVVLLHDHRNFGASDGAIRGDVDPWRQIADWRYAISYLESLAGVDAKRIGLWGTSYAGGHAIVLGATDRRLRAIVSQVPTISGFEQGQRRIPPEGVAAIEELFNEDERGRARGEPPRRQLIVSDDASKPASYRAKDAIDFYPQRIPPGIWENSVTIRSTRAARMYEPGVWLTRVSPTPILMIVAMNDTITVIDLAVAAYECTLEPKKLVTIPGGHFEPYLSQFPASCGAALSFFQQHLA
jgi:fermentation-respiration switch protein FrsA (DUF1100 family)